MIRAASFYGGACSPCPKIIFFPCLSFPIISTPPIASRIFWYNLNFLNCSLSFRDRSREGSKSHLKSKIPTMKFVCPKMKWEYNPVDKSKRRVCHCGNPCTTSSCGRMVYIYPEKNLRAYPGVELSRVEL